MGIGVSWPEAKILDAELAEYGLLCDAHFLFGVVNKPVEEYCAELARFAGDLPNNRTNVEAMLPLMVHHGVVHAFFKVASRLIPISCDDVCFLT